MRSSVWQWAAGGAAAHRGGGGAVGGDEAVLDLLEEGEWHPPPEPLRGGHARREALGREPGRRASERNEGGFASCCAGGLRRAHVVCHAKVHDPVRHDDVEQVRVLAVRHPPVWGFGGRPTVLGWTLLRGQRPHRGFCDLQNKRPHVFRAQRTRDRTCGAVNRGWVPFPFLHEEESEGEKSC